METKALLLDYIPITTFNPVILCGWDVGGRHCVLFQTPNICQIIFF